MAELEVGGGGLTEKGPLGGRTLCLRCVCRERLCQACDQAELKARSPGVEVQRSPKPWWR